MYWTVRARPGTSTLLDAPPSGEVGMTTLDDLRATVRQWTGRPLFAVLVTATLGLSLGLATVAFSLFDAILRRPLPCVDSDRLIRVHTFSRHAPQSLHGASPRPR